MIFSLYFQDENIHISLLYREVNNLRRMNTMNLFVPLEVRAAKYAATFEQENEYTTIPAAIH
jgi:hypothetical protein